MTQIRMAPENSKPAVNAPVPAQADKQPAAKPDAVTSPTEIKKP
jgi:hypothetical protein